MQSRCSARHLKATGFGEASNGDWYFAQTFSLGLSGLLTGSEVYMDGSGGTSDFEIWSTTGGASEAIPGDVQALVQIGGNSTGSGS